MAKNAQSIDTATNVQISQLQQQYANLTNLYRQLCQQDVANQAAVLDSYILLAQTYILALQTIVDGMTQPNPPENDEMVLTNIQEIVASSVQQIANVVAAPDDGE